jgi:microcystin-dependent protein
MGRRAFFKAGLLGIFAAAFRVAGASEVKSENQEDPGRRLTTLEGRVNTLESALKTQLTSSPPNAPIGTIVSYAGSIDADHPLPEGWLLCDGQSVSAAMYSLLWIKLRVADGAGFRGCWGGDGNPNFNLPDLMGRFLRGVDKNRDGQATETPRDPDRDTAKRVACNPNGNVGNNVGSVQGHELASHNHVLHDPHHAHGFAASRRDGAGAPGQRHPSGLEDGFGTKTAPTGITIAPAGGNETRPVNAYVYWIIRAK